jgi:hypothetical protein
LFGSTAPTTSFGSPQYATATAQLRGGRIVRGLPDTWSFPYACIRQHDASSVDKARHLAGKLVCVPGTARWGDGVEYQVMTASIPLKTERLDRVAGWGASLVTCEFVFCVLEKLLMIFGFILLVSCEEYRLRAGPTNVVLNDNYVARVNIDVSYFHPHFFPANAHCTIDHQDVSQGDTFTYTLGDDRKVHLSYTLTTLVPAASQGRFLDALATTTITSKAVLWSK